MKRYLILISLVLAAVSCGGRKGGRADANAADSLAATTPAEAPKARETVDSAALVQRSMQDLPEEPVFDIVTSMGTIRVKLYKDTPKHRDNFSRLAFTHFYNGTLFHRVVPGFVVQGGDPYTKDTTRVEEWGEGGPGYNIDPEFVPEHRHKKGALAAARRGDFANPAKESNGSQFYLVVDSTACSHLNGEYTVFGETVGGLNVIDRIARTQVDRYNRPERPVVIRRIAPNVQMNKRAKEQELRAEMGLQPEETETDEVTTELQLTDSSILKELPKGHVLKKRPTRKK